jgi:hypothetical protein
MHHIVLYTPCIAIFNCGHLFAYTLDPTESKSEIHVEHDEDINTSATIIPSIEILGPITRSRAQQLNHQVNSFLCSSAYNIESRLLSNDLIVLRNQGKDHGGK